MEEGRETLRRKGTLIYSPYAAENITLDFAHREHRDCFGSRDYPCDEVKVIWAFLYGFVAPFQAGCQEPC